MNTKTLLIPALCGFVFGLAACGSDSPAEAEAGVNNPFGQTVPASSATITSSAMPNSSGTNPPPPAGVVKLGAGANPDVTGALYNSWKAFHYVTMDAEAVYYSSIASDFRYVFEAQYQPAARIKWSSAQSTAYSLQCKVDDSAEPAMKFRGCTVSEGIGYGMLITAMQGDYPAFNSLWNYSRAFRAYFNNQPLTPWLTFSFMFNQIDLGSATDADLDIAASLLIMYAKTGEAAYLNDALVIANGIWNKEVDKNNYRLLSGDTQMWDGTQGPIVYNLSYFSPVALRLFAKYDSSHEWTKVLDAMYAYMAKIQSLGTGVFPDWSTEDSSIEPPNKAAGNEKTGYTYYTFNKESVRIPWRIAWDYYWYQDDRALAVLQKLNAFIVDVAAGDPASNKLSVNYSWNKALGEDYTRNTAVPAQWLSAWCATGIGTNADWLNKCTDAVNAKTVSNTASSYFPDILLVMYSQLLNGMYVRPF